MVLVGDSITAGYSAGRADAALVHRLASLRPAWFIINYSWGGASIGPYRQRQGLFPGFLQLWPQVVVIMLGTNDFGNGVDIQLFRKSYDQFLNALSTHYEPTVVCVTPLGSRDESLVNCMGKTMQDYRDVIASVCSSHGLGVVDGRRLLPVSQRYFADAQQIHPNAEGYAIMAENLANALEQYVAKR